MNCQHCTGGKKKRTTLKLGCWNVWIITTGLTNNLQEIDDPQKTAVINDELKRLNVNIALLQEIRLAGSGSLRGKDDPFFWQGKGPDNLRIHGIGFTVKNSLLSSVKPSDKGSECLLTCSLHTSKGQVTLVYTPKLLSTPEAKDEFYKKKKTHYSQPRTACPLRQL